MSHKTALILTTALTVFVLIVAGALAVWLSTSDTDPALVAAGDRAIVEPVTATVPATADTLLQRERNYQQRLDEANAQLQQAYEQIQQLKTQFQELQTQNALLLEREQIYQQRLQEANRLLQQITPMLQSRSSGPAGQLQAGRPEGRVEWEDAEYEEHEEEWDDD